MAYRTTRGLDCTLLRGPRDIGLDLKRFPFSLRLGPLDTPSSIGEPLSLATGLMVLLLTLPRYSGGESHPERVTISV